MSRYSNITIGSVQRPLYKYIGSALGLLVTLKTPATYPSKVAAYR
jgi:hypothetical protein